MEEAHPLFFSQAALFFRARKPLALGAASPLPAPTSPHSSHFSSSSVCGVGRSSFLPLCRRALAHGSFLFTWGFHRS